MGFFNPDMEDMLDVFQTESLELMDQMEGCLMQEEKQKQISSEALQAIFRIVHTMKSSSAMMGLEDMSSCTHKLEDLFLIYRETPEKTIGAEGRIFDLLYAYVDYVRSEMDRIVEKEYRPAAADRLKEQIERSLSRARKAQEMQKAQNAQEMQKAQDAQKTQKAQEMQELPERQQAEAAQKPGNADNTGSTDNMGSTDDEEERALQAAQEGVEGAASLYEQACHWRIRLQENCQMENVRAFLLMKQIRPLCGQLVHIPENLQEEKTVGQIQKEGLTIWFTTGESENVYQKLAASPYVRAIEDLGDGGRREEQERQEAGVRPEKKEKASEEGHSQTGKVGMVSWQKILLLQNVTGELITQANMLEKELEASAHSGKMEELVRNNRHLLQELENLVNAVSMLPVSSMVHQYTRAVRDICKKEDKDISFQVQGEELEVDKTLIDALSGPLLHLIRNAADHGIEAREERKAAGKPIFGKILFSVFSMGENLFLSVSDDGRGLNKEQILQKAKEAGLLKRPAEEYSEEEIFQFIFRAGFSTSRRVTEISGRGVGLDVVQKAVDRLHGSVYVESRFGEGTTITVSVPVSLTSADSIQFSVDRHVCFVPTKNVEQIYNYGMNRERIIESDGTEYFREMNDQNEELIPMIRLRRAFGYSEPEKEQQDASFILTVRGIRHRMALAVDGIDGQYSIVEKALPELIPQSYKKQIGVNGCAITADGSIGFILNIDWIMRAYERGDLYEQTASRHAGA